MDKKTGNKAYYLINDSLLAMDTKMLKYSSDGDVVGVAFDATNEENPYVAYRTNERGRVVVKKAFPSFESARQKAVIMYDDLCFVMEKVEKSTAKKKEIKSKDPESHFVPLGQIRIIRNSHRRAKTLNKVDDIVCGNVLEVNPEVKRISLGYKQFQPKPWTMAGEKYPVGSIVEGKVVRIVPFGAFVALEPTIDGLIHISQVATRRIEKVEDELKVGDIVRCKVLEVNPEAKRISLSRKEATLEEHPEIAEQIAAEKAEKERIYQECKAQRENAAQNNAARKPRAERPASAERPANDERRESRPDRRRRNSEDGDYELPPVTSTTTSLADLFAGFKTEE